MKNKLKLTYNLSTNELYMPVSKDTMAVCPYCNSGFIIITVGISNHQVEKMAVCMPKEASISLYCPYCGKDMTKNKQKGEK